ncbi:MAG: peptidoglycan-binding protein [Cyanobacteriota bacterium]|nr:peptidoglycan-binding protein [Cyanobacteriota bacterium]
METLAYLQLALNYETETDESGIESASSQKALLTSPANWLGILSCYISLIGVPLATAAIAPESVQAKLEPGERNAQVRDAQLRLQRLGYFNARATGYYGSITQASVMRFQRARGLSADGVLGSETQAALERQSSTLAQNNSSTPTYLGEGSQGNAVRSLQQRLQSLGFYQGEITGNFDRATQEAVARFQQARGLKPDGVVGPRTFAALGSTNASEPEPEPSRREAVAPLVRGQQGGRVRSLQQRLSSLGYYQGEITGNFDAATQDAVMTFQLNNSLAPDGMVGPRTFAALGSATPGQKVAQPQPQQQPAPTNNNETVATAPNSLSPERIKELQQRLKELGFYKGAVDGLWGTETQNALLNAQSFYGVSQEDIISGR